MHPGPFSAVATIRVSNKCTYRTFILGSDVFCSETGFCFSGYILRRIDLRAFALVQTYQGWPRIYSLRGSNPSIRISLRMGTGGDVHLGMGASPSGDLSPVAVFEGWDNSGTSVHGGRNG